MQTYWYAVPAYLIMVFSSEREFSLQAIRFSKLYLLYLLGLSTLKKLFYKYFNALQTFIITLDCNASRLTALR